MLQCMTDLEDVTEYLQDVKVEIFYIKRLLKWLRSVDDKQTLANPLLEVSLIACSLHIVPPPMLILYCSLNVCATKDVAMQPVFEKGLEALSSHDLLPLVLHFGLHCFETQFKKMQVGAVFFFSTFSFDHCLCACNR